EKALKLNEITGEDPITGMIITLAEDKEKENTKKLLGVALKMAKEQPKDKTPVFNVNATWILGRSAQLLRESEAAEYFLRQNAAQALKLYSTKKFMAAYDRLVEVLYAGKRYEEVEKLCREILELDGRDGDRELARFKLKALELLVRTLSKQGKSDRALKLVDDLIKTAKRDSNDVQELLLSELKGWVLREAGKAEEAAKLYEGLIE